MSKESIKNFTVDESNEKILQYIRSDNKDARIIGLFARAKKIVFENNIQLNRFYARNIKFVKELDCYSDEKIAITMKYLVDNADFKWELSTVIKYINEDLGKLSGKEPIIILSNNERVYDVRRIKELENSGRISYKKDKWVENIS